MDIHDIGLGVDCVEVSRFQSLRDKFLKRTFTKKERDYCAGKPKPAQHYAVRFAGKEAVIKALYPFGVTVDVSKIEIINEKSGEPTVRISGDFKDLYNIKISLSHSEHLAIAMVNVIKLK